MTYVNGILTSILRADDTRMVFTQQQPADTALPYVVAAQIPGGPGRVDPRFDVTGVLVQVDGYAAGSREAQDTCQAAVDALVAAWRAHAVTPDGRIAGVGDVTGPAPVAVQASGVYRYTATVPLTVR